MKTICTGGFDEWASNGIDRAKKLDRGERVSPSQTLYFESPLDMLQVLTEQRMRLCIVARTKPHSMSELATALKRDTKSVRRDVVKLERYGVLRTREKINPGHGRVKIVEPVAEQFELRSRF